MSVILMSSNVELRLLLRQNTRIAKRATGGLSATDLRKLADLTRAFRLSISRGELQYIDNKWYVTHSGLLHIARRRGCYGIQTAVQKRLSDPVVNRWVFRATVYTRSGSKGFVGYGDADPSNVAPLVRGAEMRVAETRAVNRALRRAYGIGLCSVEELGSFARRHEEPRNGKPHRFPASNGNGSSNGAPKLRDRLCVLIRKHNLNAAQVKCYAAEFCGTEVLRDASRDLVESFISSLEQQATTNRAALVCKLNSYAAEEKVHS